MVLALILAAMMSWQFRFWNAHDLGNDDDDDDDDDLGNDYDFD